MTGYEAKLAQILTAKTRSDVSLRLFHPQCRALTTRGTAKILKSLLWSAASWRRWNIGVSSLAKFVEAFYLDGGKFELGDTFFDVGELWAWLGVEEGAVCLETTGGLGLPIARDNRTLTLHVCVYAFCTKHMYNMYARVNL